MRDVELPLVTDDIDLSAALAACRTNGKSALLVQRQGNYALYSAAAIAVGRKHKMNRLADLVPDALVEGSTDDIPMIREAAPAFGEGGGYASAPQFEPDLTEETTSRRVGVRDHVLADIYVAPPKDYYCAGPRHHAFPPPSVAEGDDCPIGDGYKIVSAL